MGWDLTLSMETRNLKALPPDGELGILSPLMIERSTDWEPSTVSIAPMEGTRALAYMNSISSED